jgi:site-specific DNA-cytosine methylase
MEKLRVFEAFCGYGSQALALERLAEDFSEFSFEVVGVSDIDPYPLQAYQALHGHCPNYGDISEIDWDKVPDFDLFTYSFPCGLKGTMVKTIGGYKRIEDVRKGDMVATHNNRYRSVIKTMTRMVENYYEIKGVGCLLKLTDEHPLYVLRDNQEQWVKVKDLKKSDMISYCIPTETKDCPLSNELLWLLGRYVADGYINKYHYNSVAFAIGKKKDEVFLSHIPLEMKSRFKKYDKSCYEYRIADAYLQSLCADFGNGATDKKLPEWIYTLPNDKIDAFIDGYISGDGFIRHRSGTKVLMFATVSKELFLGLQRLMLKRYAKVCSLYVRVDKRKETFNDSYNGQIAFSAKTEQIRRGDRIFVPIKKIQKVVEDVQVFNFEVEEDNSYTCDNVNTHNCTDISGAGQQQGFAEGSGTRSSLLWECRKAILAKKPKYLLMENVKALVSKKFMPLYQTWLDWLEVAGYKSKWAIMNAKDFGVAQNRERVFCWSCLDDEDIDSFEFPEPFELEKRLVDYLEEDVDEKYFLSDEALEYFQRVHDDESHGHKFIPRGGDDTAFTIRTKPGSRVDDNFVYDE